MKLGFGHIIPAAALVCVAMGYIVSLKNPFPSASAAAIKVFPAAVSCRVVAVIDGDTIKCAAPELNLEGDTYSCIEAGQKLPGCWNVRLARIDTGETTCYDPKYCTRPKWNCEAEHKSGLRAKFLTQMMLKASGNTVSLTGITDDYYAGRRDAEVWVDGGFNLSDVLMTLGLAVEWKKGQKTADRKRLFCPDPVNR